MWTCDFISCRELGVNKAMLCWIPRLLCHESNASLLIWEDRVTPQLFIPIVGLHVHVMCSGPQWDRRTHVPTPLTVGLAKGLL